MKRFLLDVLLGLTWAATASAQPVMNGRADVADGYGAALSVQNTNTQFGDGTVGDPINGGGGSEIDQVFGRVSEGRLYVTVTGNLEGISATENRFNKLEVFVDSTAGGVNTISGSALPTGVDAFCCGGFGTTSGALQRMDGLTFDTGFDADYLLTFSHGRERVGPESGSNVQFWGITAHYAELNEGTSGAVVSAGMQLAHRGLPNVLRFPGDFNDDGTVDTADYVIWRKTEGQAVGRGEGADVDGNLLVDSTDYDTWKRHFNRDTSLTGSPWVPSNVALGVSEALVGPVLPSLGQGELIDRNYALGAGGCDDDTGTGCIARELAFALDIHPDEVGTNASNHRNMENAIDLELGFDNSNTVGVTGAGPYTTATTGNPQDVLTGLEFSIPLSQIGNPTGDIKITIFVNGTGHDYASNQFAGEGILFGNLGALMPDLETEFTGDQFVTVPNPMEGGGSAVPEPSSMLLVIVAGFAICGLAHRR